MVNYTNRDYITKLNATDTTDGLKDGTDKIHANIIRSLEQAARQNYVVSYGASNFVQEAGGSRTRFKFSGNITFMRDGVATTSTPTQVELSSDASTNTRYDLIVIASSGALAVREGDGSTATARGPDNLTAGDIPVALVEVVGGSGANITTRQVQLYGYDKTSNSLSIAYSDSSVYTEAMTVIATADRTTFKNKVANADIRFILADNTADEKFEILSDDDSDGDEGDTTVFSVDGLGATTIAGTLNLGSVGAAGTDTDKFLVLDSGGNVAFRAGSDVASDIGAATALNDLSDVSYSSGDLTITSLDKVVFANGANAELSVATTSAGTDGRDLTISAGSAPTGSANQDGGDLILNAGGGDGTGTSIMTFNTKVNGTDAVVESMRVHTNGMVGIGSSSPMNRLQINHAGADGDNGIMIVRKDTSTADTDLLGGIGFDSTDGNVPSSVLEASAYIAALAAEDHGTDDKGADLTFGTAAIDENDDTVSTEHMRILSTGKVAIGTTTPGDGILTLNEAINTKGRIQNVVHKVGDNGLSGGPPLAAYDILKTDDLIIASAPAGGGGPPQDLVLNLPDAESVDIGRTYRIVAQTVSSALQLNRTGSDDTVTDTTDAALSLPYSLAAGKIYDIVCVDADKWLLMQLN